MYFLLSFTFFTHHPNPLFYGNHKFVLYIWVFVHLFSGSTYRWYMVFVLLCLISLSATPLGSTKWQDFIPFYGWVVFCCVHVLRLYPFIHWWTLGCFHILVIVNNAYKQQKFISHSLEARKSKIKAPDWSCSCEGSLPGTQLTPSCFVLT